MGINRNLFINRAPKRRESQQLFFEGRLVCRIFEEFQYPAIQTKIVEHLGGFFHQIKVCQPIGRRPERILHKLCAEEAGGWSYFCMKRIKPLKSFQIFKIKITKSKSYSG
jgi:hypothetical protein